MRESAETPLQYLFSPVSRCNMCEAGSDRFRVLGRRLNTHQGLFPRTKRGLAVTVLKCRECGLVFPDPFPTPPDLGHHYDLPPEAYWTQEYFRIDPEYLASQLALAKGFLEGVDHPRALDVGAGIGKGLLAMEKAGFEAFGLEPSPAFRRFGLERFGLDRERFRLSSVEDADYAPGSFHFVHLGAVLEHLADPSGAIQRTLGWLAPGGVFNVEVPSSRWLLARGLRIFYRLTGSDYVTHLSPMHSPFHLYEFEERTFRVHAQDHGYELLRLDHYVGDTFAPALVRPILSSLMAATGTGMQLAVWGRKSA